MPADLLLELGAEEIPASFIGPALEDVRRIFTERAEAARLTHGEVRTYGTPRRLTLLVEGVADKSADITREVTGPSAKAGFDAEGKPTRAAEKFAESVGLTADKLIRVKTPKGEYLGAKVEEKGRPAQELLAEILSAAAHGIRFPKSMRWGDVEVTFARPLHWIVALLGEEVVPVILGDVRSGRTTRGHRFLAPQPFEVRRPSDYVEALRKAHVIVDLAERRKEVATRVENAASTAGGKVLEDAALLDQVTNLVELPNPVVGTFDERHLDLPPEVLIQEMKSHQRYFSIVDGNGKLLPRFIAVSNTPVRDEKLSLRGYERVLRARLADGRFFFDEDKKQSLEERLPKLERVVFQQKLGTYAEKVERLGQLAQWLSEQTGKSAQKDVVARAAKLCKADLVSGMVGEFPELQGVMGREYAKASGEKPEVALALFEHYLPRNAQDSLPTQDPGALVGIADRLDTLCGIFAIGKGPSGAADPFGLRRACLAVINVVLGRGYRFSLSAAVDKALAGLEPKVSDIKRKANEAPVREQVLDFFRGRLKSLWQEDHRTDVVEAVLAAGFDDLVAAKGRLDALSAIVGRADFAPLAVAFKRVVNIVEKQGKDVGAGDVDPNRLVEPEEKALFEAWAQAKEKVAALVAKDDYAGALKEITALKPTVDRFFDKVMVMAEDKDLRQNRVRLLVVIGGLFGPIADFSRIQAEGNTT